MPPFVFGLPTHVLLVHAVVVLVPLAALGTLVIAVWPAARRRFGWLVVGFAALATVCIPLTTDAGEDLFDRLQTTPLIEAHAQLGGELLIFVIGLLVFSAILVLCNHPRAFGGRTGVLPAVKIVSGVLAAALAVTAIVQVVRIGDSGARAAWSQRSYLPVPQQTGD